MLGMHAISTNKGELSTAVGVVAPLVFAAVLPSGPSPSVQESSVHLLKTATVA